MSNRFLIMLKRQDRTAHNNGGNYRAPCTVISHSPVSSPRACTQNCTRGYIHNLFFWQHPSHLIISVCDWMLKLFCISACPPLSPPLNGSVVQQNTYATFTCDDLFYISDLDTMRYYNFEVLPLWGIIILRYYNKQIHRTNRPTEANRQGHNPPPFSTGVCLPQYNILLINCCLKAVQLE